MGVRLGLGLRHPSACPSIEAGQLANRAQSPSSCAPCNHGCYVPSNSVLCSSQPNMFCLTMPSSATPGTQRKPRSKQLKDLKNHVIKPDRTGHRGSRMAASLRRSNLQNLSQLPRQLATPFFLPESSEQSQNTLGRCSARGPRWSC